MARNQDSLIIDYNEWEQLTNDDVTEITFQVLEGAVQIRIEGSEPDAGDHGFAYVQGEGERGAALSDMSTSSASRVWAKGIAHPSSRVIVDHA